MDGKRYLGDISAMTIPCKGSSEESKILKVMIMIDMIMTGNKHNLLVYRIKKYYIIRCIPPVTNIPGASGSQAKVLMLAETGRIYLVMIRMVLMSTSHSAPPRYATRM